MEFLSVDIDDTVLTSTITKCGCCGNLTYSDPKPVQSEIKMVNQAHESGTIIILHTGRGWNQYKITVEQLKKFGIKYNQLVMGKPYGPYIDSTLNYKSIGEING